jgi:hypothetical protein
MLFLRVEENTEDCGAGFNGARPYGSRTFREKKGG